MPLSMEKKEKIFRFLQNNAYSRLADDGGLYGNSYTEIQTFRELEFEEIDGIIQVDITQSPSYQQYYAPGMPYYSIIGRELQKLAATVGIQFDSKTNFHSTLIISDLYSIALLREAGIIKEKDISSQASASASNSVPASIKVDEAIASSSTPTFFSPPTSSESLEEQLIKECEELKQLEKRQKQLKRAIEQKRKEIIAKAQPCKIDFDSSASSIGYQTTERTMK